MKQALLVDDDFLVRSYLKMLPSWNRAHFEIVADVRDGEEALAILEQMNVELVVTDIAMPHMDGIQLIQEIRKKYNGIYIVALSCHDEFEYVKKAMKEGADEYVLKNTLDEESLYTLLRTAEEKLNESTLEEKESLRQKQGDTGKSDDDGTSGVNRKFLFFNQLLSDTLPAEIRERERKRAGVRGKYLYSAVIVMKLEDFDEQEDPWSEVRKEQYCRTFFSKIQKVAAASALNMGIEEDVVYIGNGVFCCFVDLSDTCRSSEMYQKLTGMALACYQGCRLEEYKFRIGVSNNCIGADALRRGYQQARMMVKSAFYDPDGMVYYEPDKVPGKELPKEAEMMLQQIEKSHRREDCKLFRDLSETVTEAFRREWTDSYIIEKWLHKLEERILFEAADGDKGKLHTIEDVDKALEKIAQYIEKSNRVSLPDEISKPVRRAAEYAAEHFQEPIGLNDAAEAASVNSTYLSYLFSQEMGVGFANYLLNLRLENAKNLLEEGNLKMRQIAEDSGFNDYHYFSKVFKKNVGVSPGEYMKQFEKNKR